MQERSKPVDWAYLTIAEAAAALRVSRTTIWRWIKEGRLAAYRAGGRTIRIHRDDLHAALRPALGTSEDLAVEPVDGNIWAAYDPARVRAALRAGEDTLASIDRGKLLEDLRKARGQDTRRSSR